MAEYHSKHLLSSFYTSELVCSPSALVCNGRAMFPGTLKKEIESESERERERERERPVEKEKESKSGDIRVFGY